MIRLEKRSAIGECYWCKKTGHIKRMCKASERGRNVNIIVEVEGGECRRCL